MICGVWGESCAMVLNGIAGSTGNHLLAAAHAFGKVDQKSFGNGGRPELASVHSGFTFTLVDVSGPRLMAWMYNLFGFGCAASFTTGFWCTKWSKSTPSMGAV